MKLRVLTNNWNDAWYQQLRKQACYVLQTVDRPDLTPEDLVHNVWVMNIRHRDPNENVLKYTKRIRSLMYYSITKPKGSCRFHEIPEKHDAPCKTNELVDLADELKAWVLKVVGELSERDADILIRTFLFDDTMKEAGKWHKITRERVRQIIKQYGELKCNYETR